MDKSLHDFHIGFFQLSPGEFMCHGLSPGFGFLPVVIHIADIVSGRRVPEFIPENLGQHLSLSDIGVIFRLVADLGVVGFRINVTFLFLHTGKEPLGTVPDCLKLFIRKRRTAFGCFIHKALVGLVCISELLDDLSGILAHGVVAAAFLNYPASVLSLIKILIERRRILQKFRKIHKAFVELHLRI